MIHNVLVLGGTLDGQEVAWSDDPDSPNRWSMPMPLTAQVNEYYYPWRIRVYHTYKWFLLHNMVQGPLDELLVRLIAGYRKPTKETAMKEQKHLVLRAEDLDETNALLETGWRVIRFVKEPILVDPPWQEPPYFVVTILEKSDE